MALVRLPSYLVHPVIASAIGITLGLVAFAALAYVLLETERAEAEVEAVLLSRTRAYSAIGEMRRIEAVVRRQASGGERPDMGESELDLNRLYALRSAYLDRFPDIGISEEALVDLRASFEAMEDAARLAVRPSLPRNDRSRTFEALADRVDELVVGIEAIQAEETLAIGSARAERRQLRPLIWPIVGLALLGSLVGVGFAALSILRASRKAMSSQAQLRELASSLERTVAERTAELTRSNAEIQRFAYIVSHDLRSPLVNVMGFTHELEEGLKVLRDLLVRLEADGSPAITDRDRDTIREDFPEALGFIVESTAKMDRLIQAILSLSREGRRKWTIETFDATEVAEATAATLVTLAERKGATIYIGALPQVTTDRVGFEQILSNLLENAVKYGHPNRPNRIVLAGEETFDRVRISVSDTGRGIAERDRQRVFELFRRAGRQDEAGEGLGLAFVRATARRLGGDVSVAPNGEGGSSFTLDMPKIPPTAASNA